MLSGSSLLSASLQGQYVQSEQERQQRILTAWERYHGRWPEPLKPTKSDLRGEDNLTLNLARLIVNKGVGFLFGYDLSMEVQDPGASEDDVKTESPADVWLKECLAKNRWMTTLHKVGTNGGVCGHTFVRLLPPDPLLYGHPYPRIVVWDPASVTLRWQPDDMDIITSFCRCWNGTDPTTGRQITYRQRIEREGGGWVIYDESGGVQERGYTTNQETEWPFPWAPVLHCQNLPCPNEVWGVADLEPDVLAVNQALNFTASNINRILRIHAHPKTWGKGFTATELQIGIDSTIVLPSNDATLANLEMVTDLSSSDTHYKNLLSILHEVSRIPEVATGTLDMVGDLSGIALQILYGPLVELTSTKRLTYGEMLKELGSRLLELGGFGSGRVVEPEWPTVLPSDTKAKAEEAMILKEVGVSAETLLTDLGYDAAKEAQRKETENEAAAELGDKLLKTFDNGGPPGQSAGDEEQDK